MKMQRISKKFEFILFLVVMFSCRTNEIIYPAFDSSTKLSEIQHIYRDPDNLDLILRKVVFTFHYNNNGNVTECFEGVTLLYRCIYDDNVLTRVETGSTIWEIKYSNNRVKSVTSTYDSTFSNTMFYEYVSDKEFTRYDTIRIEDGGFIYNQVRFSEYKVEEQQINPFDTATSTWDFKYSRIPSFISVFQLPILPIYRIYKPLGFGQIIPEVLQIASYMPSEFQFSIYNSFQVYYDYVFSNDFVREINVHSGTNDQSYKIVLIWN